MLQSLDRFLDAPVGATPDERHNFRVAYIESGLIGLISAGSTFLPVFLAIWAVVTLFSPVTSISFAVVMDATAGSRGRYELMSRRWSILGLMSGISLLVVGQLLEVGEGQFPRNYQLVFAALGLLGF